MRLQQMSHVVPPALHSDNDAVFSALFVCCVIDIDRTSKVISGKPFTEKFALYSTSSVLKFSPFFFMILTL